MKNERGIAEPNENKKRKAKRKQQWRADRDHKKFVKPLVLKTKNEMLLFEYIIWLLLNA